MRAVGSHGCHPNKRGRDRYPVGDIDGDITARAKQALCAWRETHGLPVTRKGLSLNDAYSVLNATSRPAPTRSR